MKKQTQSNKMTIIFLIVLSAIQLVLVATVHSWILIPAFLLISLLIVGLYNYQMKSNQITNFEKIQEANELADRTLEYVSKKMPLGVVVWNELADIEWINDFGNEIIATNQIAGTELIEIIINAEKKKQTIIRIGNHKYSLVVDTVKQLAYFFDVSEEEKVKEQVLDDQTVIGVLSVDNYDDAIDKMDDKEISYLNSFLTTLISDWMEKFGVYVKRLNAEKYFFISRYSDLEKMKAQKFDLLDSLRKEAENQNFPITVSIGIAYGNNQSLEKVGDIAQNNLDMALIRGGDQVVIREAADEAKPIYYGGKSAGKTKRTRVRSRAISTALKRIFEQADDVYIMGHRYPDMDALGSAFGVATLAKYAGKNAWIVINPNEIIPDVERCLQEIHKQENMAKYLITPEQAIKNLTSNSLLVMVDYHKPSLSISEKLYQEFQKVVIIDHHRRGDEFPASPLLTYIESSASSASELVSELIQQQNSQVNTLDRFVSTLLLAGMIVDTKSFSVRTTSRTFDVASYLRSTGADSNMIRYLISTDLANYMEISALISRSEYVTTDIVVASGLETDAYDSVTAAKTADTLLSMNGINAAFVITKRTDQLIGISARSSGTINVQLIMESLDGGGHFTNAATQLKGTTVELAKGRLLQAINENINQIYEGE